MGRKGKRAMQPEVDRRTAAFCQRYGLELTNQWFVRDVLPVWEQYLLPAGPFRRYLEIGVCEGASLVWALENLGLAEAVGVDHWRASRRKNQAEVDAIRQRALVNLDRYVADERLRIYEWSSRLFLLSETWRLMAHRDLIYIDGDHNALPALTDMVLAWGRLAVGGVLVLDDYQRRWFRGRPHSKEAIDAFLMAAESRYEVLYRTPRQIAVRKLVED